MTYPIPKDKDDSSELVGKNTRKRIRISVIFAHALLILIPLIMTFIPTKKPDNIMSVRPISSSQLAKMTTGTNAKTPPPPIPPAPTPPKPTPVPDPVPPKPTPPKPVPPKPEIKKPVPNPEIKKPVPIKKPDPKPEVKPDPKPDPKPEPKPEVKPDKPKWTPVKQIEISKKVVSVDRPQRPVRETRPAIDIPAPINPNIKTVDLKGTITGAVTTTSVGPASDQNYDQEVAAFLYDRWSQPPKKYPNCTARIMIDASGRITNWRIIRSSGVIPMDDTIKSLFSEIRQLPRKDEGPFPYSITVTFEVQ